MEELNNKNYILLGVDSSQLVIFEVLDSMCKPEGANMIKDKRILSSRYTDSLDYLRTQFKIKIDTAPLSNTEANGKNTKRTPKRKLFLIRSRNVTNKDECVQCLSPLLNPASSHEFKAQDVRKWFSEKLVATKIARQEQALDSRVIYVGKTFYQSRATITLDHCRIVFDLYLKDWFTMELPTSHIKSITIYSDSSFFKVVVRTKVADDISRLGLKYRLREYDIFRCTPKKPSELTNTMLVFTTTPLSTTQYDQLVTMLGVDRVLWNHSVTDSTDLIQNIFNKNLHILAQISLGTHPNWSLIFRHKPSESSSKRAVATEKVVTTRLLSTSDSKGQSSSSIVNDKKKNAINNYPATSTPIKLDPRLSPLASSTDSSIPMATNDSSLNITTTDSSIHMATPDSSTVMVSTLHQPMSNGTTTSSTSNSLLYSPHRNLSNIFDTFHYNPSPESGVLIHGSDLLCLNLGQYLNDNIINFYLNYIRHEIMSEDQRQRTHLFNVFFNTKLQGINPLKEADTADRRHEAVAKWTKKVDIFNKDFILIPINENQHWFLAIVCFPWMAGMISYERLLGDDKSSQSSNDIPYNDSVFATIYRQERVNRLREQCGVEPSPCILVFDSLQYQNRASNVKLIREYLKSEWDSKRLAVDGPMVFDKNTIRGFNPQVPQQTNNIDCGIFLLHYVEQFFTNPLTVFTKDYFQSSLLSWFENETVSKKRATIQSLILSKADGQVASNVSHNSSDPSYNTVNSTFDDSSPDIQIL